MLPRTIFPLNRMPLNVRFPCYTAFYRIMHAVTLDSKYRLAGQLSQQHMSQLPDTKSLACGCFGRSGSRRRWLYWEIAGSSQL